MATRTYIAIVEEASDGYGVSFPDLPGCVSAGDDMDDAVAAAGEALSLHLDGMIEDGLDLPDPRSLDQVDHDLGQPAGRFVYAFVAADIDDSNERVNVYLPKSLLDQIERFGRRTGIDNRSTFLRLAARQYLQANASVQTPAVDTLTTGQSTPPSETLTRAFVKESGRGGSARDVRRRIDKAKEA